jgi:predicted nucleic acid-binding protein
MIATHDHHDRAIAALDRHLNAGDQMIIVAHTLLETYSSVRRMPPSMRITPPDALVGIRGSFLSLGTVISLGQDEYVQLLRDLVSAGTVGGQVYDAAIAACARRAGVDVILTFNERHFERFAGNGLSIEAP